MRKKLLMLCSLVCLVAEIVLTPSLKAENGLTGVWASPFGIITLEQDGPRIIGAFINDGVLEGNLVGATLSFRWRDALKHSGEGSFELQPDGKMLKSVWNPGNAEPTTSPWFATRVSDPPDPPGRRSHWMVRMDIVDNPNLAGHATGSADLFFDGDVITGRFSGIFILKGADPPEVASGKAEDTNNVFLSITGNHKGDRFILSLENPQDGSVSRAEVAGDGNHYAGTWRDDPNSPSSQGVPPQHGTMSLARQEDGKTETLTAQVWKHHTRLWRVAKAIKEPWSSPVNGDPGLALVKMRDDGDPEGAAAAFAKLAQVYRENKDFYRLAGTLLDEADALERCGQFEKARLLYQEVLTLPSLDSTHNLLAVQGLSSVQFSIGGTPPPASPPTADMDLADDDPIALKQKGHEARHSGDIDTAVALYDRAIAGYEAKKKTSTHPAIRRVCDIDIASVLGFIANAEIDRKRWAEAAARVERAVAVWKSVDGGSINVASSGSLLSTLRQRQGQLPEARAAIVDAIAIAEKKRMGETWNLYARAARIEVDAGNDAAAEAYFEKAVANVEALRGRLVTDETKIGFFGATLSPAEVYEDYAAFLMDRRHNAHAALEMAERARARALLDVLDPQKVGVDPKYAFANETPSTKTSDTITVGAALKLARSENTAYLVYFVTKRASYVWLIAPDGHLSSGRIDSTTEALRRAVDAFCMPMHFNLASDDPRRALTRLLSGPVAAALAALPEGTRMTVVPHKSLALVPFAALGETLGEWGGKWSLTYLPSLSIAGRLPKNAVPRKGPLLAVGKPAGTTGLVYSESEVRRAAELFPGATILLGVSASKQKVLAELPRHRVVLLSTHTRKCDKPVTGREPGAELALELATGERLSMRDLKRGTLADVRLVVLSACETIKGPQFAGDELMNLARAFLVAGAERVVITLWKVQDQAAAEIVSAFLAGISADVPPAAALSRAMGGYRDRMRPDNTPQPPDAWAPWALVGRHD